MHHHHKKDAPSGTARRLAEVVLNARGGAYETDVRHGREGIVGERTRQEVGMHALRGGDVVGDHTVILAGPGRADRADPPGSQPGDLWPVARFVPPPGCMARGQECIR